VRRILLVLTAAALVAAMMSTTVPAFAAAPDGGCPTGFEEEQLKLKGQDSNGIPSADVNDSKKDCTKELDADPQNPAWCCDPVITVFRDNTLKNK
jgi:hypothetical protein